MTPTAATLPAPTPAVLVLEDGRTFRGQAYGAVGTTVGEAVFSTGMSGYQETLTDPSYHRQVVVMTAPHIGNTGVNDDDPESGRIWVAGYVVRDPARRASNWRSRRALDEELARYDVVGIRGIDTRALTRHLRDRGAMRVGIFSGDAAERSFADLLAEVLASPQMAGADLTADVSTPQEYVVEPDGSVLATVFAVDLGIKTMAPVRMAERGMRVHVLPASTPPAEIVTRVRATDGPVGVFFSNGPGDPSTAEHAVAQVRALLTEQVPVFGICFGNQIIGRALGFGTYKLRYGHRGINQPVSDRATGKVEVTAHNHGFAVDAPIDRLSDTEFGRVEVSHICLNDDVVEGLRCLDVPAFSVQYHPEAAAGPHDSAYLFDRFLDLMRAQPTRRVARSEVTGPPPDAQRQGGGGAEPRSTAARTDPRGARSEVTGPPPDAQRQGGGGAEPRSTAARTDPRGARSEVTGPPPDAQRQGGGGAEPRSTAARTDPRGARSEVTGPPPDAQRQGGGGAEPRSTAARTDPRGARSEVTGPPPDAQRQGGGGAEPRSTAARTDMEEHHAAAH